MPDRTVQSVTCLGCGCACDDIEVIVRADRIVEARQACPIGAAWFGDGLVPAATRVANQPASIHEAVDAAATLLSRARRPLVYLAPDISCETQRGGIALADALRGGIDSVTSSTAAASILATQARGRAGATLGEIRNRADVLIFWAVDPADRYPRFPTRYAPEPHGLALPEGRRSRTVVAVDVGNARGPADADVRIAVQPQEEVAVLTAAAALATTPVAPGYRHVEGMAWDAAGQLAPLLTGGRYVALIADGEPDGPRDPGRGDALVRLSHALNGPTRCALLTLRAGGNRSGADAVMTSQTGYPMAVDFSRGAPRYLPLDGAALARIRRGEADAVLVIGAAALIPAADMAAIAAVSCAVIGPRASESVLKSSAAVIDTAVAGIHEDGMALRMDDLPLRLRPPLSGPPPAVQIVRMVTAAVTQRGVERVAARA